MSSLLGRADPSYKIDLVSTLGRPDSASVKDCVSFRRRRPWSRTSPRRRRGSAALAEPVRRDLYLFVVGQPEPVSREQAADGATGPAAHGQVPPRQAGRRGPARRGVPPADRPHRAGRGAAGQALPPLRAGSCRSRSRSGATTWPAGSSPVASSARPAGGRPRRRGGGAGGDARRRVAERRPGPARNRAGGRCSTGGSPSTATSRAAGRGGAARQPPFDALMREHTGLVCGLNEHFVGGCSTGSAAPSCWPASTPRPACAA